MVTIKNVAKQANVSVGTASRALQGVGYVSAESKAKVMQAAKELGYIVNLGAKKLKTTGTKKTIGIIISAFNNDYFYKVISTLHEKLQILNIDLIITFTTRDPEDEVKQFKYLISNRVTTILFIPSTDQNIEMVELAHKNGIKVIQLFVQIYKNCPAIVNDDEQGCYLAAKRLIDLKCKRIILLDVDYSNFSVDVLPSRSDGFLQCLENNKGIKSLILHHNPSSSLSSANIAKIEDFNPDGIIASTGITGLKVLEFLKSSSRKIKLVSFDDNEWLEYHGVTTIRQDTEKLTQMICDSITSDDDIENTLDASDCQKVEETIIIRNE